MRRCVLNDCNDREIPPCCLDCPDYAVCPDRCNKTETTFCVGLIEERDDENKIRTIKKESAVH